MDIDRAELEIYARAVEEHGHGTPHAVGWGSAQSQSIRFEYLLRGVRVPSNGSIKMLDVGCGYGDLYRWLPTYLPSAIEHMEYVGIDRRPDVISVARTNNHGAEFRVGDMRECRIADRSFDYVVGSGLFGVATPEWAADVGATLLEMWRVAGAGIGVNFLQGSRAPQGVAYTSVVRVMEILDATLGDATQITIYRGYKPNDFTVWVYR